MVEVQARHFPVEVLRFRSAKKTARAPLERSFSVIPSPIPEAAPVTTATLFSK